MKDRIVGTLEKKKALTKAKEHKTTSVQAATVCLSCYRVFKLLPGGLAWFTMWVYIPVTTRNVAL